MPVAAADRRGLAGPEAHIRRRSGRLEPAAIVVDRQIRACTPAPGALDHVPRPAAGTRAGAAARRRARAWLPASSETSAGTVSSSAPRPARSDCGDVRPEGRAADDGRGAGRAALRLQAERRAGVTVDPARAGQPPTSSSRSTGTAPTPTCSCRGCYATRRSTGTDAGLRDRADLRHAAPPGVARRRDQCRREARRRHPRPGVRAVLRLGAYQLLHTRVPPHAAVSTTVDLCRERRRSEPAGLVNAVLRRVAERDWAGWVDRARRRATTRSDGWRSTGATRAGSRSRSLDALGGDLTELDRALTDERPVDPSGGPTRPDRPRRAARGSPARTRPPGRGRRTPCTWPAVTRPALAAIRDRRAGVQDEGSQLVALALARAPVEGRDEWWLDLCAGPGRQGGLLAGLLPQSAPAARRRPAPAPRWPGCVGSSVTDRRSRRRGGGRDPGRRGATAGSTGCCVDAPCTRAGRAAPSARGRAGAGSPRTSHGCRRCSARCSTRRSTRCGSAASSAYATCSPHLAETTAASWPRSGRTRTDVELLDARAAAAGGAGPRRRARGAAVAAPARD